MVRAVAAALAKNPLIILIPCHRVMGSDGSLVGYYAGIDKKRQLLELEGFPKQIAVL
jgi:O-6-methylguanine DNA methyltransferase